MSEKEESNLYLLIYPELEAFKIGKANNVQDRIKTLSRSWGKINYDGSYY